MKIVKLTNRQMQQLAKLSLFFLHGKEGFTRAKDIPTSLVGVTKFLETEDLGNTKYYHLKEEYWELAENCLSLCQLENPNFSVRSTIAK